MQLRRTHDFASLTLEDVLEARDTYHVHLSNLDHVVGTAVGKYLIRRRDPDAKTPDKENPRPSGEPRTLFNSVLKPWSWPAVLVLVNNWSTPEELRRKPEAFVPPRLYLPDGRIVPVCVVLAPEQRKRSSSVDLQFPAGLIGGGYPVLSDVQGEQRVGTIGCLVTDGHSVFGLTNRHVAGPPGQKSYTMVDGQSQLLGRSDANSVSTIPFSKAYHGWPGEKTISNMDAGLIQLGDLAPWTSQVYGIGEMGPLLDANVTNLDLALIGLPVKAYGGASGELKGIVKALFYRYRTVGGVDYVADFLIGPREQSKVMPTRPGDSGTIWFWDMEADESLAGIRFSAQREKILKALRSLIPREDRGQKPSGVANLRLQVRDKRVFIAVQGQDVQRVDAAVVSDRQQDEEIPVTRENLLRDLLEFCQSSAEQTNISIAAKGERLTVRAGRRRLSLMVNPSKPVAMQWGGYSVLEDGGQQRMEFALATNLANVLRELNVQLFRDWGLGQREYWGKVGHYKIGAKACDLVASDKLYRLMQENVDCIALTDDALMDDRLPMNNQARFIALADVPDLRWRSLRPTDAANHFAAIDEARETDGSKTLLDLWHEDAATLSIDVWCEFYNDVGKPGVREQGALPFRVWQIYDEMVHSLRQKDITGFVGAAGILSHYVADACQPLHVSWLHHGEREDEARVHSLYETGLLDRNRAELIAGINRILKDQEVTVRYRGGKAAANATLQLMEYTLQTLPPRDVIAAYKERSGRQRIPHMWDALGKRTIECMAEGTVYLAEMWENAWREGGGNRIAASMLGSVDKRALRRLYLNKRFLKSDWLKNMRLSD